MEASLSEGAQYNGRITWFVLLSCVVAATGALIFGYVTAVAGGVTSMEPFQKKFYPETHRKMSKQDTHTSNYCKFDSQLVTLFTSSVFISGLVATFFASNITKAFGRRASILIGSVALMAGSALGGAAANLFMLMFGRLLLGIGVGFINQSVPIYLSEMAPPKYRGAFNFAFQLSISVGGLTSFLVNYSSQKIPGGWGWRISLAAAAAPASFLTICALFLPETPNSLIQQGLPGAEHMLRKIRGTDDVSAELHDLISASNASKKIERPFRTLLTRRYRPQLVMSVAIPFFQQVTGITVICYFAPMLFEATGLGASASLLSSVALGAVGVGITLSSLFLVDRVGRRALFHVGGAQMLIPQIAVGWIMSNGGNVGRGYGVVVLVLVCVYVAGFAMSWGPLGWLVTSEIFPLEVRSAAQGVNVGVGFVSTFVVAQAFLAMLCGLKHGIFFFFAGWVGVMTGFVYMFLPETKDVPIEKMDGIWREHWFWKRYVCGGGGGGDSNKGDGGGSVGEEDY
ncbi:major facilitator superfamily protein [Striga asiatica]|uniref:Major facilitator superfamily protein n=1 Tax=Striga asiatica TaxID=4170 RepID=A0A5A7QMU8_STRAF|nr:major facilitator superfamily protein [Striga asiatica]